MSLVKTKAKCVFCATGVNSQTTKLARECGAYARAGIEAGAFLPEQVVDFCLNCENTQLVVRDDNGQVLLVASTRPSRGGHAGRFFYRERSSWNFAPKPLEFKKQENPTVSGTLEKVDLGQIAEAPGELPSQPEAEEFDDRETQRAVIPEGTEVVLKRAGNFENPVS